MRPQPTIAKRRSGLLDIRDSICSGGMPKQDTIRTVIRFGLVGGTVALVHSGLIWYFFHVAGMGARSSYWVGYFPAITLHFCLTKWWTFRCERRDIARQVTRYAAVAAVTA